MKIDSAEWIDISNSCKVPIKIRGSDGRTYSVQEPIGAGGNAVVCECADEVDGDVYAVKFLTSSKDRARLPRFEIETNLIRKLSAARHDHLVRFIASGSADGFMYNSRGRKFINASIPFFIMERAVCSLREFITETKEPIAPEIYSAQFRGLVGALETLHRHAIHRDIKPDNILVVGERWLISDFGLCAMLEKASGEDLTLHWQIPGPRFWMSPEANNRSVGLPDEIGFASDVFQLAAVFWWVVNRRHPSGILAREDWVGSDELFEPIFKALQHSLGRRFGTAKDFGMAVTQAISG